MLVVVTCCPETRACGGVIPVFLRSFDSDDFDASTFMPGGKGVRCHVAGVLAINARRISFESKLYCSVSQKSELFLFVARN